MEAIIRDGGRQYKVEQGATVDVDYRELEPGSRIEFDDVLLVTEGEGSGATRVGKPRVEGARVIGKVLSHVKGPKLVVMHFRRRKNSKTRFGHRQRYTKVQIETIEV
ncbi:MAG: 50S ribosomal protein L21 [Planctomycetes bacterium]|nr:50S ribosomal protein L21 [Planctomycetota bacterium]